MAWMGPKMGTVRRLHMPKTVSNVCLFNATLPSDMVTAGVAPGQPRRADCSYVDAHSNGRRSVYHSHCGSAEHVRFHEVPY